MKRFIFALAALCIGVIGYAQDNSNNKVYETVEQMPEFPGGMSSMISYLTKNIKYPATDVNAKKGGKVIASFVVNSDGSIADVQIVKGSGSENMDAEAVRVIKSMPAWKPGMIDGKAVRTKFTIPVAFSISE
ncbi:MAG: energy transducer TonB [Prevotellaceae bacterium]|nr:energy transducer TonB [Prevotellaceae bacterium]